MLLLSHVETTGAMCDFEVHAKMAIVLQHLPKCFVTFLTAGMFRVISGQL